MIEILQIALRAAHRLAGCLWVVAHDDEVLDRAESIAAFHARDAAVEVRSKAGLVGHTVELEHSLVVLELSFEIAHDAPNNATIEPCGPNDDRRKVVFGFFEASPLLLRTTIRPRRLSHQHAPSTGSTRHLDLPEGAVARAPAGLVWLLVHLEYAIPERIAASA